MKQPTLMQQTRVKVAEIDCRRRLRPISEAGVDSLIASIRETGVMKDAIHLRKKKDGSLVLIAGGHRLEAARRLGWEEIEAKIWTDVTDDWAAIMEIDDNLAGAEMNPLDTAVFLATRKQVYERLHPEAKAATGATLAAKRWDAADMMVDTNPETLTDLERAARFLYLQRTAFGGKVSGRNFGVVTDRTARFNLTTLEPMLEDLHSRLAGVIIECLDWAEFIPRYDREGALFYLDPPYWGCEGDYGKTLFSRDDFGRMADVLGALKGRFILSINDVPEIRAIFGRFRLVPVTTSYTISRTGNDTAGARAELLVSNFDFPA